MRNTYPSLIKALCLLAWIAPSLAQAAVQSKVLEYQDNGVTLKGFLCWDDSIQGKRPGVLVVPEWWGLNDYARMRAEMLAKLGYVALAVDMYGQGQETDKPEQAKAWAGKIMSDIPAWRQRGLAGLEALRGQPLVDTGRLAAIGYCFGGSTVVQMAYAGADLKGVVSFHGSLPVATQAEQGKIKARILAAHGAADAFVPFEQVRAFEEGLDKAGVVWELTAYSGAHHAFTNPKAGDYHLDNVAYDARADRRSWESMRGFLEEVFSGK
jgi:dienelactone hydrolase